MRLTRYHLFMQGVLAVMILGPLAMSQQGGGGMNFNFGGKGGGGGGKGGFRMDPETIFKMMSGGKDEITVSEYTVPEMMTRVLGTTEEVREKMLNFLQKKGVSSGKMSFEIYKEYGEEVQREMREKFGKGGFGKGGDKGDKGGDKNANPEEMARDIFKQADKNKDGFITRDELEGGPRNSKLLEQFDKWDANKDGKISVEEFIEYFKVRAAEWNAGKGDKGGQGEKGEKEKAPPEEEKRPVVYRFGHLPKDLPEWFETCDTDKDGQIGLYEWRKAGKDVKEFLVMDANRDGFVTVEELLRYKKTVSPKDDSKTALMAGAEINNGVVQAVDGGKGKFGGGGGKGKFGGGEGGGKGKFGGGGGKGKFGGGEGGGKGKFGGGGGKGKGKFGGGQE